MIKITAIHNIDPIPKPITTADWEVCVFYRAYVSKGAKGDMAPSLLEVSLLRIHSNCFSKDCP